MKTIPEFPDYAVTKGGCVWSKPRKYIGKKGKWLKPSLKKNGYLSVHLYSNKKAHCRSIHNLVLETFVCKRPKNMECRHLDGNRLNNKLENLCWGTRSENYYDAIKHGTATGLKNKGSNHGMSKLTEHQVKEIIHIHKTGLFSHREIAEIYNIHRSNVQAIVTKKTWQHI